MAEDFRIGSIFIYPVKSLAGIQVDKAYAQIRGFKYDRRWMITDSKGNYLSQKEIPSLALLKTCLSEEGIEINSPVLNREKILIPFNMSSGSHVKVKIFEDVVSASHVSEVIDQWLSETLGVSCQLVYMPEETHRYVNKNYSVNNEFVSFANSFPYLIISQSSLNELNGRLNKKIPVDRFRPNIIIEGGDPYFEDFIDELSAGESNFKCVKPCARCKIITIDQETIEIDTEPLDVLSGYRQQGNNINFGYRSLCLKEGFVNTGDPVTILSSKIIIDKSIY